MYCLKFFTLEIYFLLTTKNYNFIAVSAFKSQLVD